MSTSISMSADLVLPCGHTIHHEVKMPGTCYPDCADRLVYWLKDREQRHDCTLVSESNPNGMKPREVSPA